MRQSSVYVIRCLGLYKIGVAQDISKRIKQFQTGNPFDIELVLSRNLNIDSYEIERFLHDKFESKRYKNEWFVLGLNELSFILTLSGWTRHSDLVNNNLTYTEVSKDGEIESFESSYRKHISRNVIKQEMLNSLMNYWFSIVPNDGVFSYNKNLLMPLIDSGKSAELIMTVMDKLLSKKNLYSIDLGETFKKIPKFCEFEENPILAERAYILGICKNRFHKSYIKEIASELNLIEDSSKLEDVKRNAKYFQIDDFLQISFYKNKKKLRDSDIPF